MSSANRMVRIHAPFVSEDEIEKINKHLRSQEEPDYVDEILSFADEKESGSSLLENNNQDEVGKLSSENGWVDVALEAAGAAFKSGAGNLDAYLAHGSKKLRH